MVVTGDLMGGWCDYSYDAETTTQNVQTSFIASTEPRVRVVCRPNHRYQLAITCRSGAHIYNMLLCTYIGRYIHHVCDGT